jgi:DNA-binding transcriptional regulator/RsmH inhibitor MraZ
MTEADTAAISLIGEYECAVDDKRRFSLPPKVRFAFPAEQTRSGLIYPAVIMPWIRGGLAIIPEPQWLRIKRGLANHDFTLDDHDDCKLMCLSRAEHLTTDPEGRFTLTVKHCEWVRLEPGLKGRLTVVGKEPILMAFKSEEWPAVQTTGRNALAQSDEVIRYEAALRKLLALVREMNDRADAEAHGAPGPARGDGEKGPVGTGDPRDPAP